MKFRVEDADFCRSITIFLLGIWKDRDFAGDIPLKAISGKKEKLAYCSIEGDTLVVSCSPKSFRLQIPRPALPVSSVLLEKTGGGWDCSLELLRGDDNFAAVHIGRDVNDPAHIISARFEPSGQVIRVRLDGEDLKAAVKLQSEESRLQTLFRLLKSMTGADRVDSESLGSLPNHFEPSMLGTALASFSLFSNFDGSDPEARWRAMGQAGFKIRKYFKPISSVRYKGSEIPCSFFKTLGGRKSILALKDAERLRKLLDGDTADLAKLHIGSVVRKSQMIESRSRKLQNRLLNKMGKLFGRIAKVGRVAISVSGNHEKSVDMSSIRRACLNNIEKMPVELTRFEFRDIAEKCGTENLDTVLASVQNLTADQK